MDAATRRGYRRAMKRWVMAVALAAGAAGTAGTAEAERLYAPGGGVRDVPEASVNFALADGYRAIPKVLMRHPDGYVVEVDEDLVESREENGMWRMTDGEVSAYKKSAAEREGASAAVRASADAASRDAGAKWMARINDEPSVARDENAELAIAVLLVVGAAIGARLLLPRL